MNKEEVQMRFTSKEDRGILDVYFPYWKISLIIIGLVSSIDFTGLNFNKPKQIYNQVERNKTVLVYHADEPECDSSSDHCRAR